MARKMSKADEYLLRSWYPVLFSSYIDISLDILINGAIAGIIRKANPQGHRNICIHVFIANCFGIFTEWCLWRIDQGVQKWDRAARTMTSAWKEIEWLDIIVVFIMRSMQTCLTGDHERENRGGVAGE
ncbi:hypothetical protein D5086_022471 [Populus alba]|uniref:Uncharacterized protein n=1 Tax=Populus alba TaxID=43335 RepID=A0ACC4BGS5_POPAL